MGGGLDLISYNQVKDLNCISPSQTIKGTDTNVKKNHHLIILNFTHVSKANY